MSWTEDFRYAFRLLRRSPGFTAVALLALALGIGANTAIFSVVHGVLLRPLAYRDPGRLMVVWEHNLPRAKSNNVVSPGNFLHWRELNQSFEELSAISLTFTGTLTGRGDPEELPLQLVSASLFPVLGVEAAVGRTFTPDEDRPRSPHVLISDRLWRRRFNADRGITGRTITFDSRPMTVVGVMPPGFFVLDPSVDLWIPIGFNAEARTPRGRWLIVVGRLEAGVSARQAQGDMTRVAADMTRRFPDFNTGWTANVVPMREQLTGEARPALLVLLGAVGFVLLIACANVANLLLARATVRHRELAVRAALGANRRRLVRQLLAESIALAGLGGAAGLLLAWWALRALRVLAAEHVPIPRLDTVALDLQTLAFTMVASVVSGLIFGLVPAWTAARADVHSALKEGGRTGGAAHGTRARGAFVVVEVALALVLLVGAGLLLRSFSRLARVDPGFDTGGAVTMTLSLPSVVYDTDAKQVAFFRGLLERVDTLPGVTATGGVSFFPLRGLAAATRFEVVGRPRPDRGQEPVCDVRVVAHDYFKAMGIPLIKGRTFTGRETPERSRVLVINETLARQIFPGEEPIGKRLIISWNTSEPDEIIGVVGDTKQAGLDAEIRPMIYWPDVRSAYGTMSLVVRAQGDPMRVVPSVAAAVRRLDPNVPLSGVRTLDDVVANSVAQRRLTVLLLGLFAAMALALAAVGIYGVMAYTVAQRTQEIGIRMALGAVRGDVVGLVVGQSMRLAIVGIAAGGAGAFALSRLLGGLLFEVKPTDPLTFALVAALVGIVAAAASAVPAVRATRVDPVLALRAE